MIQSGSIQPVKPIDISENSCGQFAINNASRVWTMFWQILTAIGVDPATATFPSSRPLRISFKFGPGSSLADLISNPQFYEHLMGWPIGWSAPGQRVTGFAAWLQRSRGALSSLLISADRPTPAPSR